MEYLDVYKHRREAEALGVDQPDVILFLCGDNHHIVPLQPSSTTGKEGQPRRAFLGEQVITAAILDVSNPEKKKIYFLAGHGEMSPDDVSPVRGLSVLRDELRLRNFDLEGLDLSLTRRVPDDANLIIISAPLGRFQPFEEELLRQYLSIRAGRIILTLDPARDCGLDNLLYDWGVRVDDDVIYDTNPEVITDNGELIIRAFDGSHPITKTLIEYKLPLRMSPPRSVRPDPGRPLDNALKVSELAASSPTSWGEFGYRLKNPAGVYTPGSDLHGPLGVIVSSERVTAGALPFSVPGGRLVVIGSGDIFSNRRLADQGCQCAVHQRRQLGRRSRHPAAHPPAADRAFPALALAGGTRQAPAGTPVCPARRRRLPRLHRLLDPPPLTRMKHCESRSIDNPARPPRALLPSSALVLKFLPPCAPKSRSSCCFSTSCSSSSSSRSCASGRRTGSGRKAGGACSAPKRPPSSPWKSPAAAWPSRCASRSAPRAGCSPSPSNGPPIRTPSAASSTN